MERNKKIMKNSFDKTTLVDEAFANLKETLKNDETRTKLTPENFFSRSKLLEKFKHLNTDLLGYDKLIGNNAIVNAVPSIFFLENIAPLIIFFSICTF